MAYINTTRLDVNYNGQMIPIGKYYLDMSYMYYNTNGPFITYYREPLDIIHNLPEFMNKDLMNQCTFDDGQNILIVDNEDVMAEIIKRSVPAKQRYIFSYFQMHFLRTLSPTIRKIIQIYFVEPYKPTVINWFGPIVVRD